MTMTIEELERISSNLAESFDGFLVIGFTIPEEGGQSIDCKVQGGLDVIKLQRLVTLLRIQADEFEDALRAGRDRIHNDRS